MYREEDIRQSDEWGRYLETLGWKIRKTSGGISISIRPTFLGNFTKIQHPKKITAEDLKEIGSICEEEKCTYIKIEPDFDQDLSVFGDAGYIESYSPNCVPSTIFIDLTKSEDILWSDLSHSAKYSVNRAVREGYVFEAVPNPTKEQIEESYRLFKITSRDKGFYMTPLSEFFVRNEMFGDKSYLCLVRNEDGELQQSKFCLGYKDMVLYVAGGSTTEARKNKSGYLLLWEAIKFFKKEGYRVFDLEGKDDKRFPLYTKSWGGFSHFKEKFNGVEVEFPIPRIKYLNKFYGLISKTMNVSF